MADVCSNPNCTYSATGICARKAEFANPADECLDLLAGRKAVGGKAPTVPPPAPAAIAEVSHDPEIDEAPPAGRFWSGLALGGDEAAPMLWDSRTRLFTVMGEKDRGKTCFLTALYIQLANGYASGFPWQFCGSRSLVGFQRLANDAFRWKGGEDRIVPRTTHASFRQPSFLHLALKERKRIQPKTVHTLLTDMPGEWFEQWINDDDSGRNDTLEFLPRSDGFIVVIDAPRLLDNRIYAKNVQYLLNRLTAFLSNMRTQVRPIALVLTKFDKIVREVSPPMGPERRQATAWGPLAARLEAILRLMSHIDAPWDIFPVAAFSRPSAQPIGVIAPLQFVLHESLTMRTSPCIDKKPQFRGNFFECFREDVPA